MSRIDMKGILELIAKPIPIDSDAYRISERAMKGILELSAKPIPIPSPIPIDSNAYRISRRDIEGILKSAVSALQKTDPFDAGCVVPLKFFP